MRTLGFLATLIFATQTVLASDDAATAARVKAAQLAYESQLAEIRKDAPKRLSDAVERAKSERNLDKLKQAKKDQAEYQPTTKLPYAYLTRTQLDQVKQARAAYRQALDEAKGDYVAAENVAAAENLDAEIKELIKSDAEVVAAEKILRATGGEVCNLLGAVKVARDVTAGQWLREGKQLVSVPGQTDVLRIPYTPPDDYKMEIVAERIEGLGNLRVGVIVGGSRCVIVLDGWDGQISGMSMVRGKVANDNITTFRGQVFPDAGPVQLTITVHPNHVSVAAGRRVFIDWRGDPKDLSLWDNLWLDPTTLYLAAPDNASYRISGMRLTTLPVQGK